MPAGALKNPFEPEASFASFHHSIAAAKKLRGAKQGRVWRAEWAGPSQDCGESALPRSAPASREETRVRGFGLSAVYGAHHVLLHALSREVFVRHGVLLCEVE